MVYTVSAMELVQFETMLRHGGYMTPADCRPARPLRRGLRSWWRFYVTGIFGILLGDSVKRLCSEPSQAAFSEVSHRSLLAAESTGATVGRLVDGGNGNNVGL